MLGGRGTYPAGVDSVLASGADETPVQSEEAAQAGGLQAGLALVIPDDRQLYLLQYRRNAGCSSAETSPVKFRPVSSFHLVDKLDLT